MNTRTLLFCLIACVFIQLQLFAQSSWQRTFDNDGRYDDFQSAYILDNGNLLVFGAASVNTGLLAEAYVAEVDPFGNVITEKYLSAASGQVFYSLLNVTDTSYVFFGAFNAVIGGEDMFVASISHDFSTLYWSTVVGGTSSEVRLGGISTQDGGYVGMAHSQSFAGGWNHYVFKLNSAGSLQWTRYIGGGSTEKFGKAIELPNGQIVVTGLNQSNSAYHDDIGVYWLSSGGTLDSSKIYNIATNDASYDIASTLDGGLILTGHLHNSNGSSNNDAFLMKLDSTGAVDWIKGYGGSNWEIGYKILCLPDSGYVVVGETSSFGSGNLDVFAFRTDKDGDLLWSKAYGGTADDKAYGVIHTDDNGFLITGATKSFGAGTYYDAYLIKTDADGYSGGCNEADGGSSWPVSVSYASASVTNGTGGSTGAGGSMASVAFTDSLHCLNYGGNSGLTCADAINLDSMDANTVYEITDSVMWFMFTAYDTITVLSFDPLADDTLTIYTRSECIGANLDTFEVNGDYPIEIINLVVGNVTYIAVNGKSGTLMHLGYGECGMHSGHSKRTIPYTCTQGECGDLLNYFPDGQYPLDGSNPSNGTNNNYFPVKKVRVVYHQFYSPTGNIGWNSSHKSYIESMFIDINDIMRNNWMPVPESEFGANRLVDTTTECNRMDTLLGDSRIEYLLDTILFHESDDLFQLGVFAAESAILDSLFDKYITNNSALGNLEKDSAIHVFSYDKGFPGGFNGKASDIADKSFCIVTDYGTNWNEFYRVCLTIHELGHNLGLNHTFDSGFDFIYPNKKAEGSTNNVMDYRGEDSLNPGLDTNQYRRGLGSGQIAEMHFAIMINEGDLHDVLVKDYCSIIEHDVEINAPGDTISWIAARYLKSNLIIKTGTTLELKCLLGMPKDGKIIVERGAKLIINGGTVTNVCGDQWAGIEIYGNPGENQPLLSDIKNSSYPSSGSHHGVVILKNGALVENAETAIMVSKLNDPAYWGGIIIADNSTFRNNRRSVAFMKYLDNNIGSDGNISYFKECIFETDSFLNGGVFPYAHVTMWDVHGVEFIEDTFINRTPEQYLVGSRGMGIYSEDATYIVTSNQCVDFAVGHCQPFGFRHNYFEGLSHAVSCVHFSSPRRIETEVSRAKFVNCGIGIVLRGTQFIKVFDNDFDLEGTNSLGIYALGARSHLIAENRFSMDDTLSKAGVYSNTTDPFMNNVYYKNEFNSEQANNYAFPNSNSNYNLEFHCNNINDDMHHYAVFSGGINQTQGSIFNPAGNVFDLTCDENTAPHFWKNSIADGFRYFHHNAPADLIPDTSCINDNFLIDLVEVPRNLNESTECLFKYNRDSIPTVNAIKDSLRIVLEGINRVVTKYDGGKVTEIVSMVRDDTVSENRLLDTLETLTGVVSDKVFLELLAERPAVNKTRLAEILLQNYPHSQFIINEVEALNPSIPVDSLTKLLEYQDSSSTRGLWQDTLYAYIQLRDQYYMDWLYQLSSDSLAELRDSLALVNDPNTLLLLADLYMIDSVYDEAEAIWDTIPIYGSEAKDWIALRKINLDFEKQGWQWTYVDSSGESGSFKSDIETLAAQSTTAGILAGHILTHVEGDTIPLLFEEKETSKWHEEPKQDEDKPEKQTDFVNQIKLYPNPAGNKLTVEYPLQDFETHLMVYNILGESINNITLPAGQSSMTYDISSLENGTYLYHIMTNGEVYKSGKLIILK